MELKNPYSHLPSSSPGPSPAQTWEGGSLTHSTGVQPNWIGNSYQLQHLLEAATLDSNP